MTAWASAWNQLSGHGIALITGTFETGTQSFDKSGRLITTDHFVKREASIYVEYGLTEWLQAIVKPDLVSTSLGRPPLGRYTGLGTSEIGAQAHLINFGPVVTAVQGTFQLPATTRQTNPALIGNTARGAEARALAGLAFSLGSWPSYFDAEAAYRVRGSHAPDEVHIDLTLGTRPHPKLLLLLQSFTTIPTGPGVPFFPRSTYSNAEVSAVYDIGRQWSLQLGLFTTVDGRNALREKGLDLAAWYRF